MRYALCIDVLCRQFHKPVMAPTPSEPRSGRNYKTDCRVLPSSPRGGEKAPFECRYFRKKSRCGTRLSMSRLAATTAFRMRNVHHRYAIVATITLHVASIRPPFAHTNVAWPHTSRRTTCTLRFQSTTLWWAKHRFFTRFWTRPPMVQRGVWARSAK